MSRGRSSVKSRSHGPGVSARPLLARLLHAALLRGVALAASLGAAARPAVVVVVAAAAERAGRAEQRRVEAEGSLLRAAQLQVRLDRLAHLLQLRLELWGKRAATSATEGTPIRGSRGTRLGGVRGCVGGVLRRPRGALLQRVHHAARHLNPARVASARAEHGRRAPGTHHCASVACMRASCPGFMSRAAAQCTSRQRRRWSSLPLIRPYSAQRARREFRRKDGITRCGAAGAASGVAVAARTERHSIKAAAQRLVWIRRVWRGFVA